MHISTTEFVVEIHAVPVLLRKIAGKLTIFDPVKVCLRRKLNWVSVNVLRLTKFDDPFKVALISARVIESSVTEAWHAIESRIYEDVVEFYRTEYGVPRY